MPVLDETPLYNREQRREQLSLYGVATVTYKKGRNKRTHEFGCWTCQIRDGHFKSDYERKFPDRTVVAFTYKSWEELEDEGVQIHF